MLQQNIKPKPIIPTKPANIPKPNFLIVSGGNGDGSSVHSKTLPLKNTHNEIPPNNVSMGGVKKKDYSHFTIPSSPNIGDCANDCCGIAILNNAILNNKHLEQLRSNDNHHANSMHSNGHGNNEENGNGNGNSNSNGLQNKKLKTPTDSFDSSSLSSSSGGFKDAEFLTKTKVAYDLYDKEDNIMQLNNQNNKSNENLSQAQQPQSAQQPLPIVATQSKVLEIQSKLIAQQQQQQNKLQNSTTNTMAPVNIHNSSQYQKSSKELEKVLVFRIDKENCQKQTQEKAIKRLSKGFDDVPENNVAALTQQIAANISKQIQQKLQEEMKQQCQMIKDKLLIEKIPVQQHYNDYVVTLSSHTFFRCFDI